MFRPTLFDHVKRLRFLDSGLRADGISVPTQAETWGVNARTVFRYLTVLRELVGPTKATRGADQHYRHRYVGQPASLFAAESGEIENAAK